MYPYRFSNVLVGYLNLATLLASIPIIGAGLWLAKGSSASTCSSILQTPLLAIGFVVLLVSLAGFVGACFHVAWALWLYLLAVLLLIAVLLGLTAFAFAVTAGGGGTQVPGRPYREYHTSEYSAWLRGHLQDVRYWQPALACVVGSKACTKIENWTPMDYVQHDLTPIQSGCCKPPTSCQYSGGLPVGTQDEDCYKWNNAPGILCYQCDSCKAGVMEQIRQDWHKVSVLMVVVLVALIGICACGCCAFRNARRSVSEYPYGVNRMSKINPRWDYHWYSAKIHLSLALCWFNYSLLFFVCFVFFDSIWHLCSFVKLNSNSSAPEKSRALIKLQEGNLLMTKQQTNHSSLRLRWWRDTRERLY